MPRPRLSPLEFERTCALPPDRGRWPTVTRNYARAVLVDGRRPVDVARELNVSRQAVSRAARRFLRHFQETQ